MAGKVLNNLMYLTRVQPCTNSLFIFCNRAIEVSVKDWHYLEFFRCPQNTHAARARKTQNMADESSLQGTELKEDDELDELLDSKLFPCTVLLLIDFFVRLQC